MNFNDVSVPKTPIVNGTDAKMKLGIVPKKSDVSFLDRESMPALYHGPVALEEAIETPRGVHAAGVFVERGFLSPVAAIVGGQEVLPAAGVMNIFSFKIA